MRRYRGFVAVLFLLVPITGDAEDLANLYDSAKLVQEKPRFERRIKEMYAKAIWASLAPDEQRTLGGVEFAFPWIAEKSVLGENHDPGPMDYYSGAHDGQPFVALPILSLMFLEDLCTAYAWLHTRGYSLETIDEYVTMLRYKKATDFAGGRYPPPLRALQIPADELADPKVDELSLRFRNSAFAFILLHELGHILSGHRGYEGITTAQARANEQNADRFALDTLQKTSTIPMGAILFFQAQAYMMPGKGQFMAEDRSRTDGDWQAYLTTTVTHPLTADRLRAMAVHLSNSASKAGPGPNSDTLGYIATRLANIAEILEITELQGCMAVVAYRADLSSLAPRRPRETTGGLLEKWCGKKD